MPEWPPVRALDLAGGAVLSTAISLLPFTTVNMSTTAWPSANLAIFVPVRIAVPCTAYKMAIGAGGTAAGNFDVGIYDQFGNRLVSSGATAKGANTEHILDITDTRLPAGTFYLALAADGTNNYIMVPTSTGTAPAPAQKSRMAGVLQMATAYTLPATATFAPCSNSPIPAIAVYLRAY